MSDDNKAVGPTHIYNIPQSAYQNYARTEEALAAIRDMQAGQGQSAARSCALMDVAVKLSAFDSLFGLEPPLLKGVDRPPGFVDQLSPLNMNGTTLFGAVSHLESLKALVMNVPGEKREIDAMDNFMQVLIRDLADKNSVLARRGSLQQG